MKIMAGDAMGLHVNIMLPPPYKLDMVNFAVIGLQSLLTLVVSPLCDTA